MGRRLSLLIAVSGLAGAVAWFTLGMLGSGDVAAPGTAALAADVLARIRETMAGVQARADTLAQLPRLALAVATDEQTVRDLTTEELAFRTKSGEHIEIAQVMRKGGVEWTVHSLLRLPDDELPLAMGSLGPHVLVSGGRLFVVVYVAVTPRERHDELRGAIAVAQTPDLSSFVPRFKSLGWAARIEVGGRSAALGEGAPPDGAAATRVTLSTIAPEPVTLDFIGATAATAEPARPMVGTLGGPIIGPLALLLASLVTAALLRRQRRAVSLSAPAADPSPRPTIGVAPPPLLDTTAATTPTPPPDPILTRALTPPAGTTVRSTPTPPAGIELSSMPTPPTGTPLPLRPTPPAGTPVAAPVAGEVRRARVFTPAVGVAWSANSPPSFTPAELPLLPPEELFALPLEPASADADGVPGSELFGDEPWAASSSPTSASASTKLSRPPRGANEALRRTSTLPSYLFEVADGTEPGPSNGTPVHEDALEHEYRELYVEFIRMRRTCRESVDNLDVDHFVAALRKQHDELSLQYGQKSIRFRLGFHNGKAVIRFVVAD